MARDSEKNQVFSLLFGRRYDKAAGSLRSSIVTSSEIQEIINDLNQEGTASLSLGNPANFLKDYLRSPRRNAQWPAEILAAGFTARQAYGEGRVFDFVPLPEGQIEPFPDDFALPDTAPTHEVESVSLPSVARELGRADESWLIQVCVQQRILQTHFALHSQLNVVDFYHLQNSLKGTPEIDAVFLMVFEQDGERHKALVSLEAKRNEPILPDQIKSQVANLAYQTRKRAALSDIRFILPVAAKSLGPKTRRVIALFEMELVGVEEGAAAQANRSAHDIVLQIARTVGYVLSPPIAGV